jgi:hypothetical protein
MVVRVAALRATRGRVAARRGTPVALVALLALLAACSGQSGTPTAIATHPLAPTPAPTLLYRADWSHGADGWILPAHWSLRDGTLVNDGGGTTPIAAPYSVTTPDYEVDFAIQVLGVTQPQGCGNLYGMQAANGGSWLYQAYVACIGNHMTIPAASYLRANGNDDSNGFATVDFWMNNSLKAYRVQVRGSGALFFANSSSAMGGVEGPQPFAPATPQLIDAFVQIVITRFEVWSIQPARA